MTKFASQKETIVFFVAVLIAGLCSIIYELLISTTSSYFLGDSVKQFSLTIGVYMAAMGVGSYLTKFLEKDLLEWFVRVEILLGLIGGACVPILYFTFDQSSTLAYQWVMLSLTFAIGVLTGFEIPLLIRILKTYFPLKSNLAYVLSLDYIGALIATLLFPFLLLPFIGTLQTSILFGLVNIILGFLIYRFFTKHLNISRKLPIQVVAIVCILLFLGLASQSNRLLSHWEDHFYTAKIIYTEQTPYQNLVLTKNKNDIRLYINRIIQFSTVDEYRYHESLALLPLAVAPYKKKVLILGGGEGLLAREVLRFSEVEELTIVDLDPAVFKLAKENPFVRQANQNALDDPRVQLVPQDAMAYLTDSEEQYDIILADLPDPSNESLSRLYSTVFYRLVQSKLSAYGIFATQATSPFHTRNAYWSIGETLTESGFSFLYPYHTYVPSFGEWGFHLAANFALDVENISIAKTCRYLDAQLIPQMFYFSKDISKPDHIEPNHMDRPVLLEYFLEDWERWKKEKKG